MRWYHDGGLGRRAYKPRTEVELYLRGGYATAVTNKGRATRPRITAFMLAKEY